MKELKVELGDRSYPIYIGKGLLSASHIWSELLPSSRLMIVTNETIAQLYLQQLKDTLADHDVHTVIIPDGESFKGLAVMNDIITGLLENRFSRDCCLIALGGGVVGDITGFAAACYQRGVNYIQAPTTLLSQVDSSVGGKTAVNHALGKNMIGAFHQPVGVIADIDVLGTLADRELSAGLAEVIKYGLIRDPVFFSWLEVNMEKLVARDTGCLIHAIERSCTNKAEVVALDETEGGIRAILNLGHTFGHAIETATAYKTWLHGEAVGVGMLLAAELSCRHGWLSDSNVVRIKDILEKAGLPVSLPASLHGINLRDLMAIDKKARSGRLYLVLLKDIGASFVTDQYDEDLLMDTLDNFPMEQD
jgi:3-dehydroquinate synthase